MNAPQSERTDPATDPAADPALARFAGLFDLTGRQALVVGGGSGIGREVALALRAAGAKITVADVVVAAAAATAERVGGEFAQVDVADSGSVAELLGRGTPDILITTVGINVRKALADYGDADFERVVGVNLRGVFHLLRAYGPAMAQCGGGSIVAFSSIRSLTVEPGQGVYAATKAGLIQLIRTAAAEHGAAGVRANAVAPGIVATELTGPIRADADWSAAYAAKPALRRWAEPVEIAGAAVFLASDAASYITGSVLFVDGGWTAVDGRFDPPM